MREILYRGKRKDNGEWVYGCIVKLGKMSFSDADRFGICDKAVPVGSTVGSGVVYNLKITEVDPETVGQSTGLEDKNGTKIFDGDIMAIKFYPPYIERISWRGAPDAIAKVFWDLNTFRLRAKNDDDIRYADFCDICYKHTKIIGNIYDNPELLKGES